MTLFYIGLAIIGVIIFVGVVLGAVSDFIEGWNSGSKNRSSYYYGDDDY